MTSACSPYFSMSHVAASQTPGSRFIRAISHTGTLGTNAGMRLNGFQDSPDARNGSAGSPARGLTCAPRASYEWRAARASQRNEKTRRVAVPGLSQGTAAPHRSILDSLE
jgi:hypothetical protein